MSQDGELLLLTAGKWVLGADGARYDPPDRSCLWGEVDGTCLSQLVGRLCPGDRATGPRLQALPLPSPGNGRRPEGGDESKGKPHGGST